MLKRDELADPNSCLNKAADNEPIFVLRAQDISSPVLVDLWAFMAAVAGCSGSKCNEARQLARSMEDWPTLKYPD